MTARMVAGSVVKQRRPKLVVDRLADCDLRRDERGWFVPRSGTFSRLVYEAMVRGMPPGQIAELTGIDRKNTAVVANRIIRGRLIRGRVSRWIPPDLVRVPAPKKRLPCTEL